MAWSVFHIKSYVLLKDVYDRVFRSIGLITVFEAILTGKQSGRELQCLYGNPIENLPNLNFTQFMNPNAIILGRRFYSPSLKDVAWLEDAQLIFLIFHTFVCKFGWVDKRLDAIRGKKNLQTNVWKIKKISSATYRKATSFKLGE